MDSVVARAGNGSPPGPLATPSGAAVELLARMLRIPSVSGREARLARFLVPAMRRLGLRAHVDAAGNVVGQAGTGVGPTVLLLGHLDTVPGRLPVRLHRGALHGRGAVDAKGPLAVMILAAAAVRRLPARIVVAAAVEEETPGSRGAVHLTRTLDPPQYVVIGEPSGWSRVAIGYRGRLNLRYRVRCRAAHPASPLPNAGELAADCWRTARALLGTGAGHTSATRPGIALTRVCGDAEYAELDLDLRTPAGFDVDHYLRVLRSRCGAGTLEVVGAVPAVATDRRGPLVRALAAGIRRCGGTPVPVLKTGTCDMNTVAQVWQVPMAAYGPGDSRLDHGPEEHLPVDDYLRGIEVLTGAITELAEQPVPRRTNEEALT